MGRHRTECTAEGMLFCAVWQAQGPLPPPTVLCKVADLMTQGEVEPLLALLLGSDAQQPRTASLRSLCYHFL